MLDYLALLVSEKLVKCLVNLQMPLVMLVAVMVCHDTDNRMRTREANNYTWIAFVLAILNRGTCDSVSRFRTTARSLVS
jgi:formate hydrogenlyase subunit 4